MATKKKKKGQKEKKEAKPRLSIEIVTQMLTLATSGFGLVAALAWNSLVQDFVKSYIVKWLPNGIGILSELVYALVVTILAVIVTLELSQVKQRLENR